MPRNAYFKQYQSPNIIIVPTVNFCLPPIPTGSEQIPDPNVSPLKNYEEISPITDNICEPSPSVSYCNQQNLRFVGTKDFKNTSTPGFSENIRNSPSILKNTISTEVSSCNMSQSIKELSTSKFKSRNNLVDLTGFNLMKRDSPSSLAKRQDLRPIDDTKIKRDKTSTSSTDLRKKITEGSKKYRDHERRYITEYPNRSKSETNPRHLPDSKVSIRRRRIDSPDSIRRYKDFQRFTRHYDDREIKYKRENEIKTKHLLRKKIRIESCETTKIKPDVKKKESKQHATCQKSEKRGELSSIQTNLEKSKNYNNIKARHQSNSNRVYIKSAVRGDRNLPNDLSQRMDVDGVQDLRSRLSRKRSRSECFEHHEPMEKRLDRKSLVIPVTQDVKANSPILAPTVYEPKPKTRKPNELINKKCPTSDSGDSDEDSLLNYFIKHGDEIVASMYKPQHSETEHNKITDDKKKHELVKKISDQEISDNKNSEEINPKTGLINNMKSIEKNKEETSLHKVMEINSINKINENDSKSNEDAKSKVDLNNHVNKKVIEIIQEEETSLQNQVNNKNEKNKGLIFKVYMRVVKINSDTENEDTNLEIGSIAYKKKHKDVKDVDQNSKMHKNSPKKVFEELVPKNTMGLCNDKIDFKTNSQIDSNTEQQANNMSALTEKASEENAPKETISLCKEIQKITTKSEIEINIKQKTNNIVDLTGKAYEEIRPTETMSICKDKKIITTNSKNKKNTKLELETNNMIDLTKKVCQEIAPKGIKSISMDEQKIILNSNYEKNPIQETNNIIDLTGKAYEENAPKESIEISDNDSVVEVIDITGTTSKHLQPNVNQTYEINSSNKASLQTMFNIDQNKTINNPGIKCDVSKQLNNLEKHVKDKNDNAKDTVEASLETIFNNLEQKGSIRKHIEPKQIQGCTKKSNENSTHKSVDAVEVNLETIFNGTKQVGTSINMSTQKINLSGQPITKEMNVLKSTQATIEEPPETVMNILDRNENVSPKMEIELSNVPDKYVAIESESQESINLKLPETIKNSIKQNVAIKIDADSLNFSNIQENRSQTSGVYKSNQTFEEHGQTFEDTVSKPGNNIEKKTQNVLSSLLSENELLLGSDNSTKETPETPKISLVRNNEAEVVTLQKSETIRTSPKTIGNDDKKTSTIKTESSMCDKNKVIKPDKNKEETSEQKSTVKTEKPLAIKYKEFIASINKSDVKNQDKSQETMKNNTQKLQSIGDTVSNTKNSNINISNKDSDSEIFTNKTGQEKIGANNSLITINKEDTKTNKQEQQLSPKMKSCLSKLEIRISEYLQKKYTLSSLIHCGRFSKIYKCFDTKGETCAVKVLNQPYKGKLMGRIFSLLQQHRPRQDSCVLFLMNSFECQNQWCLLTEYFPKNLEQVLHEMKQGFHIDRVQVLSRQLVNAVNMLTNAGIIHSDIKPTHILLNDANDRLKLCGFDRSNFSNCMKIIPSTGTARYRAPEVILGFQEDHRIDVWSTALVIFEMATKRPLFNAYYNNGLLYQHLLTFGSFDWSMVEQSRFRDLYFSGTSFKRQLGRIKYEEISFIETLHRTEYLRNQLFEPYSEQNRSRGKSKWQITKEMDKVETLHTLLKQMLTLDPRNRLPIQFVNASEFMNHNFTSA